ncbi:sigma 54-interacting transcriptional regulator [bacterium]|nr:sigma 54-interacting transcriptional regulator [bacterium]
MYESTEIVNLANTYGAQFFLKKPIKESSIAYAVEQFLYFKNDGQFDDYLRSHYITDDDSTIKELRELKFLKLGDRPVHLNGETGTGKNHVVKLAKDWILCEDAPLIHICCSNIPEELFESEIFGSVKGSHSASSKDKIGAIEMAEGGILFLDEIDANLSGKESESIAKVLIDLSKTYQIFTISHQPQLSSVANQHFLVEKHDNISTIKKLSEDERVNEISRMISGEDITNEAIEFAKNLLKKEK